MINKVIHYCWFGGNSKSQVIEKCIESWRKFCPDYEIIEWNESNFDVNLFKYTKQSYDAKKYAFVSDVARLYIVYKYGGIYLDTDVELKKSLDDFIKYDAWFNWESNLFIASGLGFGAQKGSKYIKAMLDIYKKREFIKKDGTLDLSPCPKINTQCLLDYDKYLKRDGTTQVNNNVIYCDVNLCRQTLIHHGEGSWIEGKDKSLKEREYKDAYIKRVLRSPKVSNFIEKYMPNKIFDLYTFISYDMLEYGLLYYLKRMKINRRNENI